ncbi:MULTISPECIES: carboxylating nicotinate-nucleotide diphosphorylase [unclassified Ruegeria]|uniref:carboxylating nicotinate-nucleotide diphosphorylase n=1 Tax=unclassified Ruegeria TaxID=2625375 RepID=UPI001ADA99D7|nr:MULTISPECIES: carboxylating nicotinate-nucleotide diphosphorylase [unclassified Ruegeria]MBO9413609.1 carboxylating nicotinate-nucleotide diphosphorylase [Ruegeria sp. R8_1]MBO9417595.1 carboxylating nicotinate-nucleotide diphosphorylase [Ruegeria sp. R8_2]
MTHPALPDMILEPLVRSALTEDMGACGDITTQTVIPADVTYSARLQARENAVVSGMQVAALAFRLVDPSLLVTTYTEDGQSCAKGDTLMKIQGRAASILSAERVALNFAQRMTGVATATSELVAETKGTKARITCTRKTTPGLRLVEKQAVLHGGGFNHRFSLSDAILIKDNHIAAAGGVRAVLDATKARASHMMKIEIEVDTLEQLSEVIEVGGADVVLLDNMPPDILTKAVKLVDGRLVTEASGNISKATVAAVAATGVDYISSGALTHSYRSIDIGLDF